MFNPKDDMINWQSLIDIKNYENSYEGDDKRPFCNWTSEEITIFNKKLNMFDKVADKKMIIEAIKDIIDFGLPYQEDFFSNYEKVDYYYKIGLEKLIPNTNKIEKTLDEIINKLKEENEKEKNKFNNCLNEKNQYKKIKKFISKVDELCKSDIYKNKKKPEITEWAKRCHEYYKNNPNVDDIEEESEEEIEDEKVISEKIFNINDPNQNILMKKDDIKNNKYQDTFIKEDFNKKSEKVYKMNKSEFSKRRAMFEPLNKIQKIINNPQNQKNELNQNQNQKNNKLIQNQIQKKIKPFNNKEILAHINIGFEQIFGYRLRFTQLISLYILINKKKFRKNNTSFDRRRKNLYYNRTCNISCTKKS